MPIAVNIIPKTFSFGEFLIKQGEIPPGLMIITEGHCKVVNYHFAKREFKKKKKKEKLLEKTPAQMEIEEPLLIDFNPATSVLNQINFMEKGYQNHRVLLNKKGQEERDTMVYTDMMVFNHLISGNYFGGRVLIPLEHYYNMKTLFFGAEAFRQPKTGP